MGNNNSSGNTRTTNYKIYKIMDIENGHSNGIRCHLNDYVPYSNGNYKRMDFKEETNGYAAFRLTGIVLGMDSHMPQGVILSEGSYIAVDTNVTRDYSSGYEFDKYGGVAITVRESSLRDSTGLLQATGETAESIGRARENYALMIERARLEREFQAWHLEPPKK